MFYPYSKEYRPPAPVLDIAIAHPEKAEIAVTLNAKVDTGADISTIPQTVLRHIQTPPCREVLAIGYKSVANLSGASDFGRIYLYLSGSYGNTG